MANITFRESLTPDIPEATFLKGVTLTNLEVDANFKSLNDELILKVPQTSITGAASLPAGTTAQRPPAASNSMFRYNTTTDEFEGYAAGGWGAIGGGGVSITNNTSTDANTFYPTMTANVTTGDLETLTVSSTKMYYNPFEGKLNATSFNTLSDVNKKENITSIKSSVGIINQLRGVEFDWKDNGIKSSGVIAQELEKILPHLVGTGPLDEKSVNYSGIIGYLIEAIKELSQQVSVLEEMNNG